MKLNRKGLLALMLCLVTMLSLAAPALAANIVGYTSVTATKANVYLSADKSTIIGTFAKDDLLAVEASNGSFYKVRLSGSGTETGYVEKSDVSSSIKGNMPSNKSVASMKATTTAQDTSTTSTQSSTSSTSSSTITGSGTISTQTSLYSSASTSSPIKSLIQGTPIGIISESGSFYKVSVDGKEGYVLKTKVTVASASSASSTSAGSLSTVVGNVKVLPGSSSPSSSISSAMAAAKAKNSDTIGYIKIAGTKIDFPILHKSGSPFYYLTYDINKKKSSSAAVNSLYNVVVRNNTITAHNMRVSGTIFHELHHLQDRAVGKSKCSYSKCKKSALSGYPNMATDASARIWDVSMFGYNKWEVWAMYEVPKNEPKTTITTNYNTLNNYSTSQRQTWINNQLSRSQVKFGTAVSTDDIFLTVYTCGDNYDSATAQSRLYFFLKAVS